MWFAVGKSISSHSKSNVFNSCKHRYCWQTIFFMYFFVIYFENCINVCCVMLGTSNVLITFSGKETKVSVSRLLQPTRVPDPCVSWKCQLKDTNSIIMAGRTSGIVTPTSPKLCAITNSSFLLKRANPLSYSQSLHTDFPVLTLICHAPSW